VEFILSLVLILLLTKIFGHAATLLGQPSVLGKLIIGIVIGPAMFGWISNNDFIHYISEIGVIMLMFIAGLETNLEQLKQTWKSSLAVAVCGIIFPFIGAYAVAEAFGLPVHFSLFMGVLFSATSVSISVQVLKDLNRLNSREGTTILGAAVADDVLVVILLAVMTSFLGGVSNISLGLLISKKIIFFIVVAGAGWFIIPRFMKLLGRINVTEPVITMALVVCFAFAYFAEMMGMAAIIGSFAAGISISQTSFKHTVESKIEPIAYSIFVPVFFVSIGLHVSFAGIADQIWFIIALSIAAIMTKLFGGALGAKFTGMSTRSALAIGSGMISRGEVALIIASTGLQAGLLAREYFTSVVITVIITTLIAPPMLKAFLVEPQKEPSVER